MATTAAYDLWASVYDTDGNVLQQLDDIFVDQHLPPLLSQEALPGVDPPTVVELGCGTGRNTLKLARLGARVLAVDNSQGMMSRLQDKLVASKLETQVGLYVQNLEDFPKGPDGNDSNFFRVLQTSHDGGVEGVVSTLVLEHLDIIKFFAIVQTILKPGGWLLLTNMHPDMGLHSGAGFLDPQSGDKIKVLSINYTENEILEVAGRHGLSLAGTIHESGPLDQSDISRFGQRAQKWIGVKMHLGMVFYRKA